MKKEIMDTTEFELRKTGLLLFIDGQKRVNELVKAEKRKRLSQLTVKDSLLEYDALCNIWESNPKKEEMGGLERHRTSFLIRRRERFNRAGGRGTSK